MRGSSRRTHAISGGLAAAGLLAATGGPAAAADSRATVHMAVELGPRAVLEVDRTDLTLAPGESATVMVTVKARVAHGETLPITLESAWDGAPLRYRFQGSQGTLAGPTPVGAVSASGVHRIPLTISLDPTAPMAVRLPLVLTIGAASAAAAGITQVRP